MGIRREDRRRVIQTVHPGQFNVWFNRGDSILFNIIHVPKEWAAYNHDSERPSSPSLAR